MNTALGVFAATWAAFSFAQPMAEPAGDRVAERFPTGSIRSVGEADSALSAAAAERAEIEARYVVEEQACHPRFFTTACIEQAKERRHVAMSALRRVEIEANAFKRQVRVAERDKLLAERLEKDDRERQEGMSSLPAAETAMREIPDVASQKKVQTMLFSDRQDKHDAKMKQQKATDAASAEKRAANVAAYEKKKADALERQQKVAQRKAEKEQKRKSKQAESGKLQ